MACSAPHDVETESDGSEGGAGHWEALRLCFWGGAKVKRYSIDMFIIAAPEGLWVYHLRRIHETLLHVFRPSDKDSLAVELRQLIQKHRTPLT